MLGKLQFGVYELDRDAMELRKHGVPIRLQEQPLRVLTTLVERPGEIVTRDELRERLWGKDTFVDFEQSLNKAVNRLREALNDEAGQPRYVETVPRRGYRFIAPVTQPQPKEQPPELLTPASDSEPHCPRPDKSGSSRAGLATAASGSTAAAAAARPAQKIPLWAWPLAAVVVLAAAYSLRPTLPPPHVIGTTQLTHDGAPKMHGLGTPPPGMATDGSRIYYMQTTGHDILMQVSTDGGETVPVQTPFPFDGFNQVTPHSELLFAGPPRTGAGGGLWAMAMPGGQARRIGNFLAADAYWNNDQSSLAYNYKENLFIANGDGSQTRQILTANGWPLRMRFSPDGRLLRFTVWDPKSITGSLWEVHPDGSHLRRLLSGWDQAGNECCGTWTADGRYFIFQSTRDGVAKLWAIRETGDPWRKVSHDPVQLTQGQMSAEAPLPSLDDKKIFFIGASRRGELIRYDLKTHSFTPYLSGLSAEGLSFSKDGQRIAYISFPSAMLWDSKVDGSDRHELTFAPMEAGLPQWSPDGSQIAFAARQKGGHWHLYLVPPQGGDPQPITEGDSEDVDQSWSPDGKTIVFGTYAPLVRRSKEDAIRLLNMATHQVTAIPGSAGLFSPRWSPDGRYVLAGTGDFNKLVVYDFSTQKWQDLVSNRWGYPTWSRDSTCVYFTNPWLTELPLYRICLADHKLQHITDLVEAGPLVSGRFGWWTGLAPDGSMLALRDISLQEIYALDVKLP
jgi:Tol biopolymer transport system component/DNA-binding winged helix-turn-helix (wHTH) protein